MVNFQFYAPTKVVFGKDTEGRAGALVKKAGGTKALVLYGGGSARASGLLDRVTASLEKEGLDYYLLGGVSPNPRLSYVREAVALCRSEGVDFLLAVGGGSVIDTAKAIGYGLAGDESVDVWSYFDMSVKATACMPVGVVLTIAAAGSEMSDSAVITNEETGQKRGLSSNLSRPVFAIMNPELTYTLPPYQTAAGAVDILMHTLERFFTPEQSMELTDGIAVALMRTVMANARTLTRRPKDYAARAELMWAGSLSHNGLTGCGGGPGDWACHQLGHPLSARYDVAHGASLSAVWGSWARYVYKEDPARFATLALDVLELPDEGSDEELALAAIEEMEGFFWALDMPTNLRELGVEAGPDTPAELAEACSYGGTRSVGSFRELNKGDMEAIYRMALG